MGLFDLFYDDEEKTAVGNVIATARLGSRVVRCIGAAGSHSQLEVAGQLDLVLEFVKRESKRARQPHPPHVVKMPLLFDL